MKTTGDNDDAAAAAAADDDDEELPSEKQAKTCESSKRAKSWLAPLSLSRLPDKSATTGVRFAQDAQPLAGCAQLGAQLRQKEKQAAAKEKQRRQSLRPTLARIGRASN